jgi:lambda family phage portal protein
MGLLDRILRRQSRPAAVRMIEAASGRRWENTPPFGPLATEIMGGAANARGRGRHLRHNDMLAANAAMIYRTSLVGYGVTAASQHPDEATRRALDAGFDSWAAKVNLPAKLAEYVDALVTDGESLVVMRVSDDGALDLQHVPAELLDESMTMMLDGGRYVASGVEFGPDDQPIAYHIRPHRLTDIFATAEPPIRVPAEDVIHIFRRDGAGQHRGLSWFAPVVLPLNELGQLNDALLVSAKTQAMLCGFLKDMNGTGGAFTDGQQAGDITNISLEPGVMRVLPSGYDVTFSSPQQMQQSADFAAHSIRMIAAGLQIPEFLLSGDMRNVNYSSARTALVQFRQHLEAIQFGILAPALDRIWARWLTLADFVLTPESFAVEWFFPKQPWVDPQKDAAATVEMINAGLVSRRQAVAAMGFNIETLDAEIAADKAREASLGLDFKGKTNAPD